MTVLLENFENWLSNINDDCLGITCTNDMLDNYIHHRLFFSPQRLVRVLRGRKMRTKSCLMDEFGAALQFPSCFGENWLALEDCLCEMDECKPFSEIFLITTDAHQILVDESDLAFYALLLTLNNVGEYWAKAINYEQDAFRNRPPILFKFLFLTSDKQLEPLYERIKNANDPNISKNIKIKILSTPCFDTQQLKDS